MYSGINTESGTNENTRSGGGMLADYLKKAIRDMPLGACRELLEIQEERMASACCAGGWEDCHAIGRAIRNCIDRIDVAISEEGTEMALGRMPDYPEADMVKVFMWMLKGVRGW